MSLPDRDVQFLDAYAASRGLASRSAVLHNAVRLLRAAELGAEYQDAFTEWEQTAEAAAWDVTAGDGLGTDATR